MSTRTRSKALRRLPTYPARPAKQGLPRGDGPQSERRHRIKVWTTLTTRNPYSRCRENKKLCTRRHSAMSLPSQSAPRPDPEPKEPWRFEVSVAHAPALRRLKAPVDCGQLQRCLPLPTFTTACHACAGERTALSRRPRRSRRPSAPWSGGGDLSGGSSHRSVQTSAYLLKGYGRNYRQGGSRYDL